MTKRQVKRRKPLGAALPPITEPPGEGPDGELTLEQLATLYANEEDRQSAKQWVAKYGNRKLKAMTDAKVADEGEFE